MSLIILIPKEMLLLLELLLQLLLLADSFATLLSFLFGGKILLCYG